MDDDRPTKLIPTGLMSVTETATVLRCSTKAVYRMLDAGRLTPLRPLSPGNSKGELRIRADEPERLIDESRDPAA
jgi:hypothetical protein